MPKRLSVKRTQYYTVLEPLQMAFQVSHLATQDRRLSHDDRNVSWSHNERLSLCRRCMTVETTFTLR